jgi:DNA-binding MarR family transcriptional regulator
MKNKNGVGLKLEQFLPYRLSVLSNRISREIANGYEKRFSLALPEWRVMAVLGEEPGLSAAEVADRTAMDKVAVSRAVKKLLEDERLIRDFAPSDKRRSIMRLSQKGMKVYDQVVPMAKKYETTILEELSEIEIKQLNHLIEKLDDIRLHLHDHDQVD